MDRDKLYGERESINTRIPQKKFDIVGRSNFKKRVRTRLRKSEKGFFDSLNENVDKGNSCCASRDSDAQAPARVHRVGIHFIEECNLVWCSRFEFLDREVSYSIERFAAKYNSQASELLLGQSRGDIFSKWKFFVWISSSNCPP